MAVAHKIATKCVWSLDGVTGGVGTVLSLELKDTCQQIEAAGDNGELALLVLTDRRKEVSMEAMTASPAPEPGATLTINDIAYIVRDSETIWTAGQVQKIRVNAWLNATFPA